MSAPNPHGLTQLRDSLRQFAAERDWDPFHSPKNLAMALSVEAAELLERFQWVTEEQSEKIALNALKYPVDKSRGSAKKYSEL
jgi:dCTP diphosphatase